MSDVPEAGPKRRVPSATDERPVPPPAVLRTPVVDGVMVKVAPELVIELPKVKPLNDCVEVPMVIAPVCAVPKVCWKEVTPLEPPTQLPLIEKHPAVRLMPFPKVEVAVPETSSFWSVVEPVDESKEKSADEVVANVAAEEVEM